MKTLTYDARILRLAMSCQAHSDVRGYLNGIRLCMDGHVIGTDGHSLAKGVTKESPDMSISINITKVIPKTADIAEVDFGVSKIVLTRILASGERKKLTPIPFTVLEHQNYPDWQRIVPTEDMVKPVEAIGLNANYLDRARVFGEYAKYPSVKLFFNGDNNSVRITPYANAGWPDGCCIVIMPVRL